MGLTINYKKTKLLAVLPGDDARLPFSIFLHPDCDPIEVYHRFITLEVLSPTFSRQVCKKIFFLAVRANRAKICQVVVVLAWQHHYNAHVLEYTLTRFGCKMPICFIYSRPACVVSMERSCLSS